MLDAALARLNEAERNAVVLRFFYGRSMKEIETASGESEAAAQTLFWALRKGNNNPFQAYPLGSCDWAETKPEGPLQFLLGRTAAVLFNYPGRATVPLGRFFLA